METEQEDDVPLLPVPGTSILNSTSVKQAKSLRNRNGKSVTEVPSPPSDRTKVWGSVPAIPRIEDLESPGKIITLKLPDQFVDAECICDVESMTDRERMKINVIRGCYSKPDLNFGELRLLGTSSEGFVNGNYSIFDSSMLLTRYTQIL